jgi:hypothetical protein
MPESIPKERAPEDLTEGEAGREEFLDPWSNFMRCETPHHKT